MTWARRAAVLGLALLAGCEDATVITHVFRMPNITEKDLIAMQSHGGLPVEMHGLPFLGATREALAEAMQGPAGAAPVRFRAIPFAGPTAHGTRLVLHFNPTAPPNSQVDCARAGEAVTNPPTEKGFTVTMTFCNGPEIEAHGFMRAPGVEAGDYAAYNQVMRQLIAAIFREEKDR